jgi:hypothetical protein
VCTLSLSLSLSGGGSWSFPVLFYFIYLSILIFFVPGGCGGDSWSFPVLQHCRHDGPHGSASWQNEGKKKKDYNKGKRRETKKEKKKEKKKENVFCVPLDDFNANRRAVKRKRRGKREKAKSKKVWSIPLDDFSPQIPGTLVLNEKFERPLHLAHDLQRKKVGSDFVCNK